MRAYVLAVAGLLCACSSAASSGPDLNTTAANDAGAVAPPPSTSTNQPTPSPADQDSGTSTAAGPADSDGGPTGANDLTLNPTIIPYVPGSSASSRCLPGEYKGSFSGIYYSPSAYGYGNPVSGAIDLHLKESSNSEFLSISGGTLSGDADYIYPFSATLTGTLDCTTNKFSATMKGSYTVGTTVYPYNGTLDSNYDPSSESLTGGSWACTEPNQPPPIGGKGMWSAKYFGP